LLLLPIVAGLMPPILTACDDESGNAIPPATGGMNGAMGGSPGAGGSAPTTELGYFDGNSRLAELPETTCDVTVTSSEVSPDIATVGIVTFDTTLPDLRAAEIHFGRDTSYGLVAPVESTDEGHRTLLLGMVQEATYHFRVAVSDGTRVCYSEDATIETGSLDSPALAEARTSADGAPGFIVTSRDGEIVIYDKQGELVWAFEMFNVFSAQMSWDGQFMVARDPGPFDLASGGNFMVIAMDGSEAITLDAPGGDHHDFTAIPDGIAYIGKRAEGECDWIYEASLELTNGEPTLDTWPIYRYFPDEGTVEGTEICHANRLHYSLERDWYTVSDRNKDAIAVFARDGTPLTSIGKAPTGDWMQHILAENAGPGGDWHIQHGHHFYADDGLVLFANESDGGAALLHYTLEGDQATLDWKYDGAGASMIQGDAQRLDGGNFLVTANLDGTMVELGSDGTTEVSRYVLGGPTGPLYGFGYAWHRPSLYGTPAPR
jgi:hypothetical protein